MTWTNIYLVCFLLGFSLSAVSWLLGALGLSFAAVTLSMVFFAPQSPPEAGVTDGGVVAGPADAGVAAPTPGAPTPARRTSSPLPRTRVTT